MIGELCAGGGGREKVLEYRQPRGGVTGGVYGRDLLFLFFSFFLSREG